MNPQGPELHRVMGLGRIGADRWCVVSLAVDLDFVAGWVEGWRAGRSTDVTLTLSPGRGYPPKPGISFGAESPTRLGVFTVWVSGEVEVEVMEVATQTRTLVVSTVVEDGSALADLLSEFTQEMTRTDADSGERTPTAAEEHHLQAVQPSSDRASRSAAAATFTCPACGWPELDEEPRTNGGGGSYDICPSCGFEFGVTGDDKGYTYESWRNRWIAQGMPWWSTGIDDPPAGWDPRAQLRNLENT